MCAQSVTFGRIVGVNNEAGTVWVETRIGERFVVAVDKCDAETLDVAVCFANGNIYAVTSLAAWADVTDEITASYRVAGLA